jgi:hypothetical protein
VDIDGLSAWLDRYGRTWERMDADGFAGCFAEEAEYRWGPWAEPLRGRDEIRERFEQAVSHQADVEFGHEPLAITPDGRGIARWWVSMRIPDEGTIEEDEGIFLVTFASDGLCSDFREWWNGRSRPA